MPDRAYKLLVAGIAWPPETFLARLVRGLADLGVEVTLACSGRPDRSWLAHPNIRWQPLTSWAGAPPIRLARLAGMGAMAALRTPRSTAVFGAHVRRLASRAERWQAWNRLLPLARAAWDVIYFPWNSAAIDYLPVFDLGRPVVVSCRGAQVNVAAHNPRRQAIAGGLRATFARAAVVHCVSEDIRRAAAAFGLDTAKACVIRPAVDPAVFRPAARSATPSSMFRIATTGSLVWRKGHEYALTAVRAMVDRGVDTHLDIVGDGPERQRLLFTIADLGLAGRVELHGRRPPERVRDLLQSADAFLLSSLSEGISNAALEAMACGLPVVTTDCGGMREAIDDGVEGFVVPVRDADGLAGALSRLANDAERRRHMGVAARNRILRQFRLDRQVEEFDTMFQGVLERKAS
jgi:colanic acid/amylovoran biosynthesis glycosyltransferase